MIFRLAKIGDVIRIAEIQRKIKDVNSLGIFCHLSKGFLKRYYRILIEDPTTIFLCAENEKGEVCGFSFNVLDAGKQNENMKRMKFKLAGSAIVSVIKKPKLLLELYRRYKSINNNDESYLHNEGAHGGYWGWDPDYADSVSSLELHERGLYIAKILGVSVLHFEVDKANKHVFKFHKVNGARIEKEFILPDGRERVFMNYDLNNHKYKF